MNVPARAYGRRHVVLAPWFLQAVQSGQLRNTEALAVIAQAALVARSGLTRHTLTIALWTLPWRTVCMIVRPLRGLLPEFVWKAKFVVFAVAIWQSVTTGPPMEGPVSAAALAIILTTTYLTPVCARRWQRTITMTADRELVDLGLGSAMAALLRRDSQADDIEVRLGVLDPLAHNQSRR